MSQDWSAPDVTTAQPLPQPQAGPYLPPRQSGVIARVGAAAPPKNEPAHAPSKDLDALFAASVDMGWADTEAPPVGQPTPRGRRKAAPSVDPITAAVQQEPADPVSLAGIAGPTAAFFAMRVLLAGAIVLIARVLDAVVADLNPSEAPDTSIQFTSATYLAYGAVAMLLFTLIASAVWTSRLDHNIRATGRRHEVSNAFIAWLVPLGLLAWFWIARMVDRLDFTTKYGTKNWMLNSITLVCVAALVYPAFGHLRRCMKELHLARGWLVLWTIADVCAAFVLLFGTNQIHNSKQVGDVTWADGTTAIRVGAGLLVLGTLAAIPVIACAVVKARGRFDEPVGPSPEFLATPLPAVVAAAEPPKEPKARLPIAAVRWGMIVAYFAWAVALVAHAVLFFRLRNALQKDTGVVEAAKRVIDGQLIVFAAIGAVYVLFWVWCLVSVVNARRMTRVAPGLAGPWIAFVIPLGLIWVPFALDDQSQIIVASAGVVIALWISMAIGIRVVRGCLATVDGDIRITQAWSIALAGPYVINYYSNKIARGDSNVDLATNAIAASALGAAVVVALMFIAFYASKRLALTTENYVEQAIDLPFLARVGPSPVAPPAEANRVGS